MFFFSKAHLKIKLKTKKHSKKSISFDFIEFRILRYVLRCSILFRASGEGTNNSGGEEGRGGRIFLKKQISRCGGCLFGTLGWIGIYIYIYIYIYTHVYIYTYFLYILQNIYIHGDMDNWITVEKKEVLVTQKFHKPTSRNCKCYNH